MQIDMIESPIFWIFVYKLIKPLLAMIIYILNLQIFW